MKKDDKDQNKEVKDNNEEIKNKAIMKKSTFPRSTAFLISLLLSWTTSFWSLSSFFIIALPLFLFESIYYNRKKLKKLVGVGMQVRRV